MKVLVGRRKAGLSLLGGPWSEELDGGNPLLDSTCLLRTVRRTVLAQSLVDVDSSRSPVSLVNIGEVHFSRPAEIHKGKAYPAQEDVSVFFIATFDAPPVIPVGLSSSNGTADGAAIDSEYESNWERFVGRCSGKQFGPSINHPSGHVDSGADAVELTDELNGESADPSESNEAKDGGDCDDTEVIVEPVAKSKPSEGAYVPKEKPAEPLVLICQQPVSAEVSDDKTKRSDVSRFRYLFNSVGCLSYSVCLCVYSVWLCVFFPWMVCLITRW